MIWLAKITLLICVLSLGYSMIMMLAPDKYRREIRSIAAIAAAVTIFAAASGADFSDISAELGGINFDGAGSYSYNSLVKKELEGKLSDYLGTLLSEEGIECKKTSVWTTIDKDNCISISEASIELDGEYRSVEQKIRGLIRDKIGDIDIKIKFIEN